MPRNRNRPSSIKRNNIDQVNAFFKRLAFRFTPSKKQLSKFWAFITVVATIVALITFFGRDMQEIFNMYFNNRQFRVAKPQETLVIIFDFSGEMGVDVSNRIYSYIKEKNILENINNVRIERYKGAAPLVTSEATDIGNEYNATFVIWGIADTYGIKPKFTVLHQAESITRFDLEELYSDKKDYNFIVSQAIPEQFENLIYLSAGQIARLSGNYQESIYLSTKAVNITNNSNLKFDDITKSLSYIQRGHTYYQMGNYSDAIKDYTASLGSEMDGSVYCFRGIARSASTTTTGDISEVMNDGNLAKDAAPDNDCGVFLVGSALIQLGKYEQAVTQLSYAVEISPDNTENHATRGLAYFQLGDYKNALNDLNAAVTLDTKWAVAYCFRGEINEKIGNKESAISDYKDCIKLDSDSQNSFHHIKNLDYYQNRLDNLIKQ